MSSLWNQYDSLRNEIEMKIEARLGGGLISDRSFKRGADLKGMAKRLSELVVIFICMFLISIKKLKSCIKKYD